MEAVNIRVDASAIDLTDAVELQRTDVDRIQVSTTPGADGASRPTVTQHGHGISSVVVAEGKQTSAGQQPSSTLPEGLPRVKINGVTATELPTALGTLLSFERSGVRYVVGGFVSPSTVEAVARGL